jgi:hypothetical protein
VKYKQNCGNIKPLRLDEIIRFCQSGSETAQCEAFFGPFGILYVLFHIYSMYSVLEVFLASVFLASVFLASYTTDVDHAHSLLHARVWSQSLMHLSSCQRVPRFLQI